MVDIGNSSLKRICRRESKKKKRAQKLGFDNECYILRKELSSLGRAVKRNSYDLTIIREKYVLCTRNYKLLKKKEKQSWKQLLNHLCTLQSKDTKQFWSIVNKMKNTIDNGESYDIHPDKWVNTKKNCIKVYQIHQLIVILKN